MSSSHDVFLVVCLCSAEEDAAERRWVVDMAFSLSHKIKMNIINIVVI